MQARDYANLTSFFATQTRGFVSALTEATSKRAFMAAISAVNATYPGRDIIEPGFKRVYTVAASKILASQDEFGTQLTKLIVKAEKSLTSFDEAHNCYLENSQQSNNSEQLGALRQLAVAASKLCGGLAEIHQFMNIEGHDVALQTIGITPLDADTCLHVAKETKKVVKATTKISHMHPITLSLIAAEIGIAATNIHVSASFKLAAGLCGLGIGVSFGAHKMMELLGEQSRTIKQGCQGASELANHPTISREEDEGLLSKVGHEFSRF